MCNVLLSILGVVWYADGRRTRWELIVLGAQWTFSFRLAMLAACRATGGRPTGILSITETRTKQPI